MINLLPYDTKRQVKAARVNVILIRLIIILGFAAGFLALACSVTYLFIANSQKNTPQTSTLNLASNPIQKQSDVLRTNLSITKSILDQQISYSNILAAIAAVLPRGSVLKTLSINDGSFGITTNLKALAKSSDVETLLKQNFESSTIFSNYTLQTTTPNADIKYPFIISFNVTINKGSGL